MRAPPWITVCPNQLLTEIPSCEAGYMAAPERFAKRRIPLAPRAPSIHGPVSIGCKIVRVSRSYPRQSPSITISLSARPRPTIPASLGRAIERDCSIVPAQVPSDDECPACTGRSARSAGGSSGGSPTQTRRTFRPAAPTAVLSQMRQYPLLNFAMAKSACAGAIAVRPSASTPIAKRNFFIAHSPLCDALLPPLNCY